MAKLSKVNKYAILWLNHSGFSIDQIVSELKVTEQQVSTLIETQLDQEPPKALPKSNPKNLMITHTSGKRLNNVAIMTKDASAMADETRKNNSNSTGRNQDKNIFRPNK